MDNIQLSPTEIMLLDSVAVQLMPAAIQLTAKQVPNLTGGAALQLNFGAAASMAFEAATAYLNVRRALVSQNPEDPTIQNGPTLAIAP